jgi:hypothetical protein
MVQGRVDSQIELVSWIYLIGRFGTEPVTKYLREDFESVEIANNKDSSEMVRLTDKLFGIWTVGVRAEEQFEIRLISW